MERPHTIELIEPPPVNRIENVRGELAVTPANNTLIDERLFYFETPITLKDIPPQNEFEINAVSFLFQGATGSKSVPINAYEVEFAPPPAPVAGEGEPEKVHREREWDQQIWASMERYPFDLELNVSLLVGANPVLYSFNPLTATIFHSETSGALITIEAKLQSRFFIDLNNAIVARGQERVKMTFDVRYTYRPWLLTGAGVEYIKKLILVSFASGAQGAIRPQFVSLIGTERSLT